MNAELGLALSAGVAQLLTNLDNFAVMLALLLTVGRWRVVCGFAVAQVIMLAIAMSVAEGAEAVPDWTGYLGLVPILLGLKAIWLQTREAEGVDTPPSLGDGASLVATTLLFLSLSSDSFAALTALFADTRDGLRLWALIGAASAATLLACVAVSLSRSSMVPPHWVQRLERLGPYAMIAVGLYVLLNSATDTI